MESKEYEYLEEWFKKNKIEYEIDKVIGITDSASIKVRYYIPSRKLLLLDQKPTKKQRKSLKGYKLFGLKDRTINEVKERNTLFSYSPITLRTGKKRAQEHFEEKHSQPLPQKKVKKATKIGNGSKVKEWAENMILNPTEAERAFADYLEINRQIYEQQVPIKGLSQWWIADFLVDKNVIEIDGGYHLTAEQRKKDKLKDKELKKLGFNVIRYTNEEVFKMAGL